MSDNSQILKIISNETKSSIDQMSVVTPSVYASIFSKFASDHDTKIEDEEDLSHDILATECSVLTDMQETTSQNANALSDSTAKAINAIKEKDETVLNEVLKETQELRSEIEKLKESVYKDELTNVYNRKWLHHNYTDKEGEEFLSAGVISMIDLNYFKLINDTHGHITGDKVLIYIANQLKKSGYDVVRYGGDEFLILFSDDTTIASAKKLLSDMRESIISKKLKAHNAVFKISFSMGFCHYEIGDNFPQTIENADKDMYEDKEAIKKRITGIEA